MSTIFAHIGQCGVQIGKEFWLQSAAQDNANVQHNFFESGNPNNPHAIFIDAERKVINKFAAEAKKYKINVNGNSVITRKGCGANFALGYHNLPQSTIGGDLPKFKAGYGKFMVDKDSTMLEVCTEAIRVKVEACESFSGFVGVNSLGGGTGAGFGARLCEELRDFYPTAYRLWNVVVPHSEGESPTQHYNQLLSLAKLQQNCDAIISYDNDEVLKTVTKRAKTVSLSDMNRQIAATMAGLFYPVSSLTPPGGQSVGVEPWELIRSVAPMPNLKLLQTFHTTNSVLPASTPSQNIFEKLTRNITAQNQHFKSVGESTISSLCVCRGIDRSSQVDVQNMTTKLKNTFNFVEWNPFPVDTWLDLTKNKSREKSMTMCCNLTSIPQNLCRRILQKSRLMFEHSAYLHWYSRYNVTESDFIEAFEVMENTIMEYKKAALP